MLQELNLGPVQQVCDQAAREVVSRIKILGKLDIAEKRRPQDGAFRARVEREGEPHERRLPDLDRARVLRRERRPPDPRQDERPEVDGSARLLSRISRRSSRRSCKRPSGIVLITGPTGSGKSTTLYAALMTIYRPEIRILTAEDPIEYVYEQFSQSEVNDRIGNTFARYLRAFLRHDPEVIMIGEIRDEETAEMAFRAAQTGHLLLSTLHTNDADLLDHAAARHECRSEPAWPRPSSACSRSGWSASVCQDCREEYEPSPELLREFFPVRPAGFAFYRGRGCEKCNHSGYRGRMSVAELWVPNDEDIILISKKASMDEIRASAHRSTISMVQDAWERLAAGRTNLEELIRMLPYSSVYQFRQAMAKGEHA